MLIKSIKFAIFFGLLIFFSCGPKRSIQEKYADILVNKYIEDVETKYHLRCTSITWGMYEGILRLIGPRFATHEKLNIPRSRELIIELSNELIKRVNESEELRPYLKNYPFTFQNIGMTVTYRGDEPLGNNELEFSFLKKGLIYYEDTDLETKRYKVVHRETFEEAVTQAKNQAPSNTL